MESETDPRDAAISLLERAGLWEDEADCEIFEAVWDPALFVAAGGDDAFLRAFRGESNRRFVLALPPRAADVNRRRGLGGGARGRRSGARNPDSCGPLASEAHLRTTGKMSRQLYI